MIRCLCEVGNLISLRGAISFSFRTAPSADSLKTFLEHLREANVAVNFDPANMLLYNNGDPIEALRALGRRVQSCHVKDANVTKVPSEGGQVVEGIHAGESAGVD
jgi:L-ribulose-5-phosphate 3-epimerase